MRKCFKWSTTMEWRKEQHCVVKLISVHGTIKILLLEKLMALNWDAAHKTSQIIIISLNNFYSKQLNDEDVCGQRCVKWWFTCVCWPQNSKPNAVFFSIEIYYIKITIIVIVILTIGHVTWPSTLIYKNRSFCWHHSAGLCFVAPRCWT